MELHKTEQKVKTICFITTFWAMWLLHRLHKSKAANNSKHWYTGLLKWRLLNLKIATAKVRKCTKTSRVKKWTTFFKCTKDSRSQLSSRAILQTKLKREFSENSSVLAWQSILMHIKNLQVKPWKCLKCGNRRQILIRIWIQTGVRLKWKRVKALTQFKLQLTNHNRIGGRTSTIASHWTL